MQAHECHSIGNNIRLNCLTLRKIILLKTVKGFCCLMQEIKNGIDRTHHKLFIKFQCSNIGNFDFKASMFWNWKSSQAVFKRYWVTNCENAFLCIAWKQDFRAIKKATNHWFVAFCPFADHFCPVGSAEREALELILSQNLIKPQTTDNQVQITT